MILKREIKLQLFFPIKVLYKNKKIGYILVIAMHLIILSSSRNNFLNLHLVKFLTCYRNGTHLSLSPSWHIGVQRLESATLH